jgi:DNA-binding response OmpR family regulator
MKALIAEGNCKESDYIVMVINLYLPNFELTTVDSGKECLDIIKDNTLNIVILGDLTDMSILDVIEQIRGYSEVSVMVLTNKKDEYLLVKAFDAGADGYMTMPFHQLELIARVRSILRRK